MLDVHTMTTTYQKHAVHGNSERDDDGFGLGRCRRGRLTGKPPHGAAGEAGNGEASLERLQRNSILSTTMFPTRKIASVTCRTITANLAGRGALQSS